MEGKINSKAYTEIIEQPLNNLDGKYGKNNYYFQQDNAGIHTSKVTSNFYKDRGTKVLPSPARSLDLNPTENAWKVLSGNVYENRQYKDKKDL